MDGTMLQAKLKPMLDLYVSRLLAIYDKSLVSIFLYGSAASGEFTERYSDVNLMVVLDDTGLENLYRAHRLINLPNEGNQTQRDHYDFRLYRGYDVVASARIFKVNVPPRQWSLSLGADMFESGHVYTVVLRQVYDGSAKSWRSYQSFKVIMKAAKDLTLAHVQ